MGCQSDGSNYYEVRTGSTLMHGQTGAERLAFVVMSLLSRMNEGSHLGATECTHVQGRIMYRIKKSGAIFLGAI